MEFIKNIFSEKHLERVRITLDEATTFIGDNMELAEYIAELYKRARKYGIGVTLIVQGVDNLYVTFKSEEKEINYGSLFLQNTLNLIILAQKKPGLDAIEKYVGLTQPQFEFLNSVSYEKERDVRGIALVMSGN